MTATYFNTATKETYILKAEYMDIEKSWDLANYVCRRNNWNLDMFCNDVKITVK